MPKTMPEEEGHLMTADADVLFVRAEQDPIGTWRFTVTVQHPDTGWEDYSNGWDKHTPRRA